MTDSVVVIYHAPCSDGLAARWVFDFYCIYNQLNDIHPIYNQLNDIKPIYIGLDNNAAMPEIKSGSIVYFLDICFPRDQISKLLDNGCIVVILDHHKSNEENLKLLKHKNLTVVFDSNRSGCQITWDYFTNATKPWYIDYTADSITRPWFIDYIADRDLWAWKLPDSKYINNAMFNLGFITLKGLNILHGSSFNDIGPILVQNGKRIDDQKQIDIDYAIKKAKKCKLTLDKTYTVWLCPCSNPVIKSDLGNQLATKEDVDFAVLWEYNFELDEWWVSLRGSDISLLDLSQIASQFKPKTFDGKRGGGHTKASGATIYGSNGENLKTYFT